MSVSIDVAEAKANLSRLIDRAAGGEEIVIARSGKPVARLMPPRRTAEASVRDHEALESAADDVLLAPMSEEDIRWATGYYQKDNGLYYTKADLARLRKQGLYDPPPKAKKKRARKPC